MPSELVFIPVTKEHRALLKRWLGAPHVREWWGDVEHEIGLIYDDKGEHEPYLASIDGEPVAYIQAWWPSQHPHLDWLQGMSPTTRGIDLFVGDAERVGRGFGSAIVKAFAVKLFGEGATRLIIDPHHLNARAIAAYAKAGFTAFDRHDEDVLMELHAKKAEAA